MKNSKTTLLSSLLAVATLLTVFLFTSTSAEAGHRRLAGHASCGAPIYSYSKFRGYNSCNQRVYSWVTQPHRCSSSCSYRRARVQSHCRTRTYTTFHSRPSIRYYSNSYRSRPVYTHRGNYYRSSGCRIR